MIFALVLVITAGIAVSIGYNWGSHVAMDIAEKTIIEMDDTY